MPDFDAVLYPPARAGLEAAGPSEREDLQSALLSVLDNPWWDEPLKSPYIYPPAILTVYNDRTAWVICEVLNDWTLGIYNLGVFPARPRLR